MALNPIAGARTAQERAAGYLREKIIARMWQPGAKLPNEKVLMERFHFSRATVRGGIAILTGERLVEATQTLGTYVRDWVRHGSSHTLEELLLLHHGQDLDRSEALTRQTLWLRRAFYRSICTLLCQPGVPLDGPRFLVRELPMLFRKDGGIPEEVIQDEERVLVALAETTGNLPVAVMSNALRRLLEVPSRCGQADIRITDETHRFEALLRAFDRRDEADAVQLMDVICALREPQYVALARGMSKRD
jgi:DNA-binding FadR family transcriptional regulator